MFLYMIVIGQSSIHEHVRRIMARRPGRWSPSKEHKQPVHVSCALLAASCQTLIY